MSFEFYFHALFWSITTSLSDIRKVFVKKKVHIISALIEGLHREKKEKWLVSHHLHGGNHFEAGVLDPILLSATEGRTAPRLELELCLVSRLHMNLFVEA